MGLHEIGMLNGIWEINMGPVLIITLLKWDFSENRKSLESAEEDMFSSAQR